MFTSSPAYLTNTIKSLTLQLLLTESIDFNQKRFQKPPLDHRLYKQLHSEHERDTAPRAGTELQQQHSVVELPGKSQTHQTRNKPNRMNPQQQTHLTLKC